MKGPGIQTRLAEQNRLAGWRECRRHRWSPRVQVVGDAVYRSCTRCPVTVRNTVRGS
jgi:hypothetical protein